MKYSRNNKSGLYLPDKEPVQFFAPPFLGVAPSAGGQVFLVNENCEGTGTPANWTNTGAGVNWDYATAPNVINGSQSLRLNSDSYTVFSSYASQTTAYAKFRLRILAVNSTGTMAQGFNLAKLDDSIYAGLELTINSGTDSLVKLFASNGSSGSSSVVLAASTNYYVWFTYVSGGTCDLGISVNNTRPSGADGAGGDVHLTFAGPTGTVEKASFAALSGSCDYVYDDMQVSTTPIS